MDSDIIFARLLGKLKASGPIRMELFEDANALANLPDDEFLVEIMKRHSPITEEEGAALGLTGLLIYLSSFTEIARKLPSGLSHDEVLEMCFKGGCDQEESGYIWDLTNGRRWNVRRRR